MRDMLTESAGMLIGQPPPAVLARAVAKALGATRAAQQGCRLLCTAAEPEQAALQAGAYRLTVEAVAAWAQVRDLADGLGDLSGVQRGAAVVWCERAIGYSATLSRQAEGLRQAAPRQAPESDPDFEDDEDGSDEDGSDDDDDDLFDDIDADLDDWDDDFPDSRD